MWWIKPLPTLSPLENAPSPSYPIKSAEYLCHHLCNFPVSSSCSPVIFSCIPWAHYFLFLIDVGEFTESEVVASQTLLLKLGRYPRVTLGQISGSYSHLKLCKLVTFPTKAYILSPLFVQGSWKNKETLILFYRLILFVFTHF